MVARAASRDDMRPVLTGVFVTASGSEMTMVATDSYRLSFRRTEVEGGIGGDLEANIPARALRELGRILSAGSEESAEVSLLQNQAVFRAGGVILNTRLIEGQFPNYRQLLPGVLRARRAAAAGRVPRRDQADQPAGAAQRAAEAVALPRAS